MSRAHVVHKGENWGGGNPTTFAVWCEAGDLNLSGLTSELAARWVAKHEAEHL
jgi:hypothetical protein